MSAVSNQDLARACTLNRGGLLSGTVLEQGHATRSAPGAVPRLGSPDPDEAAPRTTDEPSRLGSKLDVLATWLFMIAGVVLLCGVIAAILALSTTIDTLGVVSPQVESQSRLAIAAALFGGGVGGAGIVAGLAGILKALVRRRDL
jgi:hypothetical protein